VNSWRFEPGDALLFHGGDRFAGSLANASLAGSPASKVTIGSYGGKRAVIDAGSGDGIHLNNPEFLTIERLIVKGAGWTGTKRSIDPHNGGCGIYLRNTRVTGLPLRKLTIAHCVVTGFYSGISLDSTIAQSTGFENVIVSANVISDDLSIGFNLQGWNAYGGGPVDQNRGIYVGYNVVRNIPGDPKSGAGGIHGTFKTEAGGMQVANASGATIERNYLADIAGYGGVETGLVLGGSTAIVVTNSRGFRITANEVTRTNCIRFYDGSAIDVDQDSQDGEIDGNLTYDNVGPSIQVGSFGGKTSGNIRIHHNISVDDARGNNSGGESEQGAIRLWGNTDGLKIFNNTICVSAAGTKGYPSALSIEQVPVQRGDHGANTNVEVVDNIFKTTGGVPVFRANRKTNPARLGISCVLGNLYDSSGSRLVIADDTGAAPVTSLAWWHSLGFEALDEVDYGVAADAGLLDPKGFVPPPQGFTPAGKSISAIKSFDLKPGSAAIGAGIDPWLAKSCIAPGSLSFHGMPVPYRARMDVGACPYAAR
jgi:hypothetical protein